MTVDVDLQMRPAVLADKNRIADLIHASPHVHRHLDWRYPLDWIGSPPFYVLENQGRLQAALACPPDPASVVWVRLFVVSGELPPNEAWQPLWEVARLDLVRRGSFTVAAIILQDWFPNLLEVSGFASRQSIVMLERDGPSELEASLVPGFSIRAMSTNDLPAVAAVDAAAFARLWQNSLPDLQQAFPQALLASVAEAQGRLIGYQLSTRNPLGMHLARLAVRPEAQGRGVGYALLADLVRQTGQCGLHHLTVNTQSDNAASLALYQRAGFHETGERYPVYQLQIP
jgi:ribosomal protein S18 acetylase RimI-like enzyme